MFPIDSDIQITSSNDITVRMVSKWASMSGMSPQKGDTSGHLFPNRSWTQSLTEQIRRVASEFLQSVETRKGRSSENALNMGYTKNMHL